MSTTASPAAGQVSTAVAVDLATGHRATPRASSTGLARTGAQAAALAFLALMAMILGALMVLFSRWPVRGDGKAARH